MTRRCIESSLLVALAAALGLVPMAVAGEDYFFGHAGYHSELDGPEAANRINLQPIALTAGSDYLDSILIEDVLVRCSVYTGVKGVRVLLDGDVAEGDQLEPVGSFPLESKKTKGNGFAVFEKTAADLRPTPDLSSVDDPLLVAMSASLEGTKVVDTANYTCTIGVPTSCASSDTVACLGNGRFKTKMYWKDPFNGESRLATVEDPTKKSARFVFQPVDNSGRVVTLTDDCASKSVQVFTVAATGNATVETMLEVTDTATGVVRQYPGGEVLDTEAFETCP